MSVAACLRSCVLRLSVASSLLGRNYHALARAATAPRLLGLPVPTFTPPVCGFKVRGRLQLRCKDCYFVIRERRKYVLCKTHPRHKQMAMKAPEKCNWILTCATQSKVRPW